MWSFEGLGLLPTLLWLAFLGTRRGTGPRIELMREVLVEGEGAVIGVPGRGISRANRAMCLLRLATAGSYRQTGGRKGGRYRVRYIARGRRKWV